MNHVFAEVPATTANLGPGFDALGLALDLWNEFEFAVDAQPGRGGQSGPVALQIDCEGEGAGDVPTDERNLVYRAFARGLAAGGFAESPFYGAVHIRIRNRVPLSSGLGSSATAIVGGLLAASVVREMLWEADGRDCGGSPGRTPSKAGSAALSPEAIIDLATEMEGHPDNVAPAVLGGLTASVQRRDGTVKAISVAPPEELRVCVAVPDFYLNTPYSRAKLPSRVSREDAVFNLSRAALWVAAMAAKDLEALRDAAEDRLHQPYRTELIPGLKDVFAAAYRRGALGVSLSGSGPSVAAFCREERAEEIGEAMRRAFRKVGVTARVFFTRPAVGGARVTVDDRSRSERRTG